MRRDQKLALAGIVCLTISAMLAIVALSACGPSNAPDPGGYAQRIVAPTATVTLPGCLYGPQGQADRRCTPGAINPEVTQDNISSTICIKGWTKTVRPPVSYTNMQKTIGLMRYGQLQQNAKDFEEDHLIPLELGGAPRNPDNLWPEPWADPHGARTKDNDYEDALHAKVCSGAMQLAAAQQTIQLEWTH